MKLKDQLSLVRLATFAATQLVAVVDPAVTVADLRVLRDSGTAAVVARAGSTPAQVKALADALKAVPPPKKGKEGREIALVPSVANVQHADEDDEDEPDDE